jgi:type I restriction enzyme R subunit
VTNTPQEKIAKYREDLRFFMRLRASVGLRYADVVDFKEYEPKIQKLIDTHVTTGGVEKVTELVNIFDEEAFRKEVEKKQTTASKADTIAHRTKKVITERMQDDPAFYRKFSEMLEEAIRAFRQGRLDDKAYLARVTEIQNNLVNRKEDHLPKKLDGREIAKAFYGVLLETIGQDNPNVKGSELAAELAVCMDDIVLQHRIVNWVNNADVQNRMRLEMEDLVIDQTQVAGKKLDFDTIDVILERVLDIAKRRYAE